MISVLFVTHSLITSHICYQISVYNKLGPLSFNMIYSRYPLSKGVRDFKYYNDYALKVIMYTATVQLKKK